MARDRQDDIQRKVEQAMGRLGQERYETNPFLYTRIKAQLDQEAAPPVRSFNWALQPALVACLLLLNSFVVWNYWQQNNTDLSMADEYGWTEVVVEDYVLMPEVGQ